MIRFNCDYLEAAHPRLLEAIARANFEQNPGYSEDTHSENAARMIADMCGGCAGVHFLAGGTLTNLTLLSAALRPHQGVISADTGHIGTHECGAVEATGHKVLPITSADGKLTSEQVAGYCRNYCEDETREHMVMPAAVYISDSTELGTVYTASELKALREICDKYSLLLYMDGARLGYAMASEKSDIDLKLCRECCDAFYIGGTKQGALFGEALVISNAALNRDFRSIMKQKGGLTAKGFLMGIQFEELLKDGLYMELSRRAVCLAMRVRASAIKKGLSFAADSPTNQQFIVMPNDMINALSEKYAFANFGRYDDSRGVARFCTSWATTDESVAELCRDIEAF